MCVHHQDVAYANVSSVQYINILY